MLLKDLTPPLAVRSELVAQSDFQRHHQRSQAVRSVWALFDQQRHTKRLSTFAAAHSEARDAGRRQQDHPDGKGGSPRDDFDHGQVSCITELLNSC